MARKKDGTTAAIESLRPYVKRAMEDPDLRDDLERALASV